MTSYEKRVEQRKATSAVKAKEKEMKDEKEAERQVRLAAFNIIRKVTGLTVWQRRIEALRAKRAAKEEKARYEKLAETMHRKRVERLRRREKRNKMLKS